MTDVFWWEADLITAKKIPGSICIDSGIDPSVSLWKKTTLTTMIKMMVNSRLLLLLLAAGLLHSDTSAFVVVRTGQKTVSLSLSSLNMAPRFDKTTQKWIPTSEEEMPEAGYPPIGSLLRQGPRPYLQRVFSPDDYEQAVLKFMAGDNVNRNVAQANMDAYLRNPQDWMYARMEEKRKGFKVDYLTLDTKQIALTSVWSVIVLSVVGRAAFAIYYQEPFWAFL